MTINGEQPKTEASVSNGTVEPIIPALPAKYPDGEWTPQTIISTLPHPPQANTSSPLPFLHTIARLKTTKREGWRRFGINAGESIADHMYRMAIITMLCPPALLEKGLDVNRATRIALIHDVAESLVGDITPVDNVSKVEKNRREKSTMEYLCCGDGSDASSRGSLLAKYAGGGPGKQMQELWQEYEDSATLEAKFVHDVDKIELLLQTVEYERASAGRIDLGEFTHVARKIELVEMQSWAAEILRERGEFWETSVGREASDAETKMSEERRGQLQEYYGKADEARRNREL